MGLAVVLQLLAVALAVVAVFTLAGLGWAMLAASAGLGLVGWSLEQGHRNAEGG